MVATTSHIFSGKVDIASNLQVGSSHLFVDTENNRVGITTASPDATLHVNGNVYATRFEGDGSLLTGIDLDSNLEEITNTGNVTSNAVQFTNPDTGIITTGNVNVGNKLSVASLTSGSVPYIDGDNTLTDSHITQGTDKVSITSNLEVTGNILMSGETYKIDSQSLEVKDRIVGIAYDNTLSGADTGILMEYPTKNIGLIHHGASGNPYAQEFTIGYTQNTATDTTILNDPANKITVNVLGDLHTQNNMTVDSGGSYFGDGTTLTGVALETDMTSNAARIANIETVNATQTGLITGLRTDVTSNSSRITTLETANTVQAGLITSIKSDVTSNTARIATLEAANTVQAGLITAIETDVTDNAARITTLEDANIVQAGLITSIETDVTDNAARITTLEAANTVQTGLITAIEADVTDNAARITTLEDANTVQAGLITAIETDITGNAARITTLEAANIVQAGLITAIETDVADNAARITNLDTNLSDNASRVNVLEATDVVYAGLLSGLRTDLDDTFITKTSDSTIISSNLEVTGNIFMRGDRFVIESETTLINDAIIGIANNNTVSTTDVGILMQRPTANVALVHHGGTDTFTIGYTQDTLEATDITNDTTNEINVNVLGQLHVQNNMTVGAGGSYYGDGSTLTGVALVSDAASNVTRIANLETANTVQAGLITTLTNDLSDNAGRITTLEDANTVQAGLITTLTNDLSDNAARVSTLETDMTSNATRISSLEDANTVQGGLITVIETDVTSNATRITNLEASNTDIWSNLELLTLNDVVNVNNATSNTVQFTNADTSLVASGNVTVSGNVTSTTALISNAVTIGTPKEFIVTVSGGFYFDGVNLPSLELYQGQTYIFDQSHWTNGSHPLAFATVHRLPFPTGSDLYTTGITSVGTPGNAGAKTTFVVPLNAPSSIYYYCTNHGSSLGSSTASSILSTAELFVSGRIVASGNVEASAFKGDGTTLTGVALEADLTSNVTRIAALETSNLTYTPLITGLRTDMTSNSGRIDALEPRVTNLEASNVDIWSNLTLLTLDDVVNVNNATSNTVRFTNAITSLTASGNVTVSGNVTSTTALISNAATLGTTKEFVVTASGGVFYIDGVQQLSLELHENQTYLFDLTNPGTSHPFRLATLADGGGAQNGSGSIPASDYTAGTDYTSIANHLKFTVPPGAPSTLYYYCTIHSGMGGSMSVSPTAELIVSGRVVTSGNVEASSFKGDGSQLTNIASNLQAITDNGNVTSNTVQFTNTGTSLVASGTVEAVSFIGSGSQLTDIASNLEQIVNNGNVTSNTILLTDATTGLVATGNVEALKFIGDGSELTNIASNLEQIANNGNVTSNTILLTDATTGLVATGNVHALKFIGDGSALSNLPTAGVWEEKLDGEIYFIDSNVGISNNDPGHNLSVGSNLYVDDDGSNVLVVTGNVKADYFVGNGSLLTNLPSGTGGVWSTNDYDEIYFIDSNVGISNADPGHNLSVGSNLYVDDDGSNVLVVTGNVKADYFVGNGSLLTNLPSGTGGVWSTNDYDEIYFIDSNVGISNADPGHNLSVGSNLYVDDDGSNVLVIDGNLSAESMTLGGIGIVPSYPLSSVTDTGNVTPHTIEFTNAITGLVTTANVEVGGELSLVRLVDVGVNSRTRIGTGSGGGTTINETNQIAIGEDSGYNNQGQDAIAIGRQSGWDSQSSNTVAIGTFAGAVNQSSNAVAVGYQSGNVNQSLDAVAIGYQAGASYQGDRAVAIGNGAGSNGGQGQDAIAIGNESGNRLQSSKAVAVGTFAGKTNQGNSAIAIGYLAGETDQGDNSIILNATGVALDSTTASSFHVKPVRGGNFAASALAYTSTGEIVEETNTHFDTNGNVGIGTTSPLNILHLSTDNTSLDAIDSSTFDKYSLIIHNTRGSGANGSELGLCFNHYDTSYPSSSRTPGAAITHERIDSWSKGKLHFKTKGNTDFNGACTTRMTIDESGNVGIGRNNPACALDIAGEDVMIRGNTPSLNFSEGTGAMDGAFRIRYDGANQADNNNFLAIQTGTNFGITSLHCTYGGNVGIGTSTINERLQIAGNIGLIWSNNTRIIMNYDNSYRQGIELEAGTRNMTLFSTTNDSGGSIVFKTRAGAGSSDTDYGTERMRITSAGNVGIGTTNPSAPLDVPGGIASPGFQAQYSLTCAGLVTWTGTHLSWVHRIIAIPVENNEFGADGYMNIYVPASGTSITKYSGSSGSTTTTTTADGFPIGTWEALWYVVTPGQGPGTVDSQYVITSYTNSTWKPNSNWLLLAVRNGDTYGYLKFIPTNGNYYTWITPTFENSWVNYSTNYNSAGYYRDGDGIVRLRGLVKLGTTSATIFTLPVGFRPTKQELFVAISDATNVARVDVKPTGEVYHNGGGNAWFSLDGITFKAIQ